MTSPSVTISFGRLEGWELGVAGASELGTTTTLATYTYEDITAPVTEFSIHRGRQHELDRIEAAVATLTLMNQDGAFTPTNTASPYYPDIRPMVPIKIIAEIAEPFDPNGIAGLSAWYDFSDPASLWEDTARTDPVDVDTDIIKGVTDKSGDGHHLSEATDGPTYRTGIQNGLSVARFDGTNDKLTSINTLGPLAQPHTIFVVTMITSGAASQFHVLDSSDGNRAAIHTPNTFQAALFAGSTITGTGSVRDSTARVWTTITNGASSKLYLNGGTANATGNAGSQSFGIPIVGYGNGGGNLWPGDVHEILIYSGALSLSDINEIGNYLGTKWGITWTTAT